MTGNVVEFGRKEPHASGEAICRNCKHEWAAVAPVGVTQLECPECSTEQGAFKYPFGPAVGDDSYTCNCGSEDFFIMRKAGNVSGEVRCRQCGVEALGWFE
ncbi:MULTISPECIES: hypothetical protein [Pseudomonas]|uniref:hypothetical protein n=1 Tax=Pseudomonas TaxID=286 RepID=UPI0030038A65